MRSEHDIGVTLRISGPSLDSCLVSESLQLVEKQLFEFERRNLQSVAEELSREIPKVAAQSAEVRLQKLQGHALQLTDTSKGSILLIGAVGGLVVWVLKATIGETVTDAWRETHMHKQIKRVLLTDLRLGLATLASRIERRLTARLLRLRYRANVSVSVTGSKEQHSLRIDVDASFVAGGTPTYGEVLDEEDTKELDRAADSLSESDL